MIKRVILTTLGILLVLNIKSQSNKRLLLYSEQHDVLIPNIEKILSELTDVNNNEKILSEISNLNRISSNVADEVYIREIMDYYSDKSFNLSEEAKSVQNKLEDILVNYDYFLRVKINIIQDLIEYQMFLYERGSAVQDISESSSNLEFPSINIVKPVQIVNFFISPKKNNYELIIDDRVKSLFPHSNHIPKQYIYVNNYIYSNNASLYFAPNDTINITIDVSDRDTRKENIKFKFRQIDLNGRIEVPDSMRIKVNNESNIQNLIIGKKGDYYFGVRLFDGISYSIEDTIHLMVISRPELFISDPFKIRYKIYNPFQPRNNFFNYEVMSFGAQIKSEKKPEFEILLYSNNDDPIDFYLSQKSSEIGVLSKIFNRKLIRDSIFINVESLVNRKKDDKEYYIKILDRGVESNSQRILISHRYKSFLNVNADFDWWRLGAEKMEQDSTIFSNSKDFINYNYSVSFLGPFFEFGLKLRPKQANRRIYDPFSVNFGNTYFIELFHPKGVNVRMLNKSSGEYNTFRVPNTFRFFVELTEFQFFNNEERIDTKRRLGFGFAMVNRIFYIKKIPLYLRVDYSFLGNAAVRTQYNLEYDDTKLEFSRIFRLGLTLNLFGN